MRDHLNKLEKRIRKDLKHFTLNEAAAVTGLSIDDTRDAMDEIIQKYICRLQVTENGDLIYDFGKSLRRRDKKPFKETLQDFINWLWKIFKIIFKAWITVTLVVYFVAFAIIMIILLTARRSQQRGGKDLGGGMDLSVLYHILISIFRWQTNTGTILYRTDREGYRYRQYESKPSFLKKGKKSFIASVYDYVFGPPRVQLDPFTNEKEVAAYLAQQKGIIVPAELEALAGWSQPQAETFLTDCLVRFDGTVKVSDKGIIYGEFDQILRGLGKAEKGDIIYYWDEYEPEYELTGNSGTRNLLVTVMNGFNLFFSYLVVSGGLAMLTESGGQEALSDLSPMLANSAFFSTVFGWIPFIFSLLFFLIPLVRWSKIRKARQQRHSNNIRKRIYKAIFQVQGRPQAIEDITRAVNTNTNEEQLSQHVIEKMVKELVLDLNGDVSVSDQARVEYSFPRIEADLTGVVELRRGRKLDVDLGKVVVDSD